MSSNRGQRPTERTETDSVSLSSLRAEMDGTVDADDETAVSEIASAADRSVLSEEFSFQEERIKGSLDELLVVLAGVRSSDTHGKQLIEDLDDQFDTSLSPGTVYPRLHDLCDEGVLERRELVRTKEYTIDDPEAARETIAESARQHLALGLAFKAALEEGDFA
ncbi:PadR family transcriptional regulator [Natronomonas marina]|jgi:DNA-binding PadR family transcriptional regulator|uniref:PadR family transcriptional regulator n=1 Tax=Natronomonas marina TaxID=2961939 RepID=UPI0020C94205|nr:helix-turn-helix transcriptional regulator [Natronomonas marina]